jgi:Peptidase family C101
MRKMRGDSYGILRATLCQMVMKKFSWPRASEAIDSIDRELAQGGEWIRQWTFGHRLPYGRNNVIQGIHLCLETLDRLVFPTKSFEM